VCGEYKHELVGVGEQQHKIHLYILQLIFFTLYNNEGIFSQSPFLSHLIHSSFYILTNQCHLTFVLKLIKQTVTIVAVTYICIRCFNNISCILIVGQHWLWNELNMESEHNLKWNTSGCRLH